MDSELQHFFHSDQIVYCTSAPGRLDVMGGIADYSGSLVLQMPIRERTTAWVAQREDGNIRVRSQTAESRNGEWLVEIPLHSLVNTASVSDSDIYDSARIKLSQIQGGDWAAYAIGCYLVLWKEKNVPLCGADIFIHSDVPIGKGVSSSAAIEVAVMSALAKVFQVEMGDTELPTLAQRVENRIVGAPCGIMDQLASYLGRENKLLPILCQPSSVYEPVDIPEPIHFVGIDSGVRHAVSGASYSDVRVAAFMGYSIIALHEGASLDDIVRAKQDGNASLLPFSGYLANIDLSLFESRFWDQLPERMSGRVFFEQFGDTIDPITSIEAEKEYAVSVCTAHPVFENHRVNSFAHLLQSLNGMSDSPSEKKSIYRLLGEAMFESHSSYSACGLGCYATDELVQAVCDAGSAKGVYGAKITGGGSGGTVCVLCVGEEGLETVQEIAGLFAEKHAIEPVLFTGSSPGARWQDVVIWPG